MSVPGGTAGSSGRSTAGSGGPASGFAYLERLVADGLVPGASAAVAGPVGPVDERAFGLCDLAERRPFTTRTVGWSASITKPVTVATAMTLVEQAWLDLDAPVERYLPAFADQPGPDGPHLPYTPRHLMTHTSGLMGGFPTRQANRWALGGALEPSWFSQSIPAVVETLAATPLEFAPGERVAYSNAAMFVLARIIEVIAGEPYAHAARRRILDPLDMSDSTYTPPPERADRVACIYKERDGEPVEIFRFDPALRITNTAPDGGLFSRPGDYIRFVRAFLDGGGPILSPGSVDAMTGEQVPGYALGWAIDGGVFNHFGSSGTHAWGDPTTGTAAVCYFQYAGDPNPIEEYQARFWELVRG